MQARVFQNSKDALSGAPLELPAVHFVCGHSFNLRSLGENEKECPICAPQFRAILDIKQAMRTGATEQASTPCHEHEHVAAASCILPDQHAKVINNVTWQCLMATANTLKAVVAIKLGCIEAVEHT